MTKDKLAKACDTPEWRKKGEEAMKRNGDVFTRRLSMSFYRKLQFALGIIRKPRLNF